jgi:hypothetical protein
MNPNTRIIPEQLNVGHCRGFLDIYDSVGFNPRILGLTSEKMAESYRRKKDLGQAVEFRVSGGQNKFYIGAKSFENRRYIHVWINPADLDREDYTRTKEAFDKRVRERRFS